jgi:hypothetical protein
MAGATLRPEGPGSALCVQCGESTTWYVFPWQTNPQWKEDKKALREAIETAVETPFEPYIRESPTGHN